MSPVKPAKSISPEAEFRSRLSWFLGVSDPVHTDPDALTYEPYFGLREKPFSLAADPRFFFTQSGHGSAFNTLAAGIKRREGILVLTGEVGTGKTTLCRAVLQSLDRKTFAAFVSDPFLSREDLLKTLLVDFGVVSPDEIRRGTLRGASRADLSHPLYEFLASLVPIKAFAVVIIDEAHSLSTDLLDEIRVLSDLESGPKLLQVFLVGQPELETRLADPAMRQLSQRVAVRCELPPLTPAEVGAYIAHRLDVAGNDGRVRFSDAAIDAVHAASAGIPRVINLLCDRALTRAASLQTPIIDVESITWGRGDLKLPGAAAPTLALVHSQPYRPSWREVEADAPAQELDLPTAPDSLVQMLSGAMGDNESKPDDGSRTTSPAAADQQPETGDLQLSRSVTKPQRAEPENRSAQTAALETATSRTLLAIAVAVAVIGVAVAYRAWFVRSAPSSPRVVEQPADQAPPAASSQPDATKPAEAPTAVAPQPQSPSAPAPQNRVAILMATFASDDRTAKSLREIEDAGFPAFRVEVTLRDGERGLAVYAGPYDDRANAERDLARARELSGYEGARIVAIRPTVRP